MRNIMLIQRHSPFNTSHGRESFDLAMALAAIEHKVTILFMADAVLQLVQIKDTATLQLKPYQHGFKLFDLYEIEQVLVCQASLQQRGLTAADLFIKVTIADHSMIKSCIAMQHQVITS
ncbi:sulfurtransferase complex subunit TusC [Rheinheimera sp. MMS21-TC3]|uniref:sulfurtransferase complex subunit TusC n=1 Tax=Rheinheimera sp. MMS21-TC3 TaxID=3072790 RepID=UPI0028C4170B|nr:sulfurtransferase complex subunit TusC [Rheinheimera sp. MMS21-TC3]WNO60917.1 sulfurtransferase complex subunit TusC [Rheinheimera sp. MMS21-TC3]